MGKFIAIVANLCYIFAVANYTGVIFFLKDVDFSVIAGKNKILANGLTYISFWNLLVQLIFFSLSLVEGLFITGSGKRGTVTNYIYATLAFPLGILVPVLFWSLFLMDRNLVFPPPWDSYIPLWANHLIHTVCLPLHLLELFLVQHKYPSSRIRGCSITAILGLCYTVWLLLVHQMHNVWVYPILNQLDRNYRSLFLASIVVGAVALNLLGEKLNNMIWGGSKGANSQLKQHSNSGIASRTRSNYKNTPSTPTDENGGEKKRRRKARKYY